MQSNNFDDADKEMAYLIWVIEKEFNFPIFKGFPLMKLFNLCDEYNCKKYIESTRTRSNNTII